METHRPYHKYFKLWINRNMVLQGVLASGLKLEPHFLPICYIPYHKKAHTSEYTPACASKRHHTPPKSHPLAIPPAMVQLWKIRPGSGRIVSSRVPGTQKVWNSLSMGRSEAGAGPFKAWAVGRNPSHPDLTARKLWIPYANPDLLFWMLCCDTELHQWPQVRHNSMSYPPTK